MSEEPTRMHVRFKRVFGYDYIEPEIVIALAVDDKDGNELELMISFDGQRDMNRMATDLLRWIADQEDVMIVPEIRMRP